SLRHNEQVRVDSDVLDWLASQVLPSLPGSRRGQPGTHRSAFLARPVLLEWVNTTRLRAARDAWREGSDAMPMRRAIGISLACLVTSACATGQIPETVETAETSKAAEESTPHDPGEAAAIPQQNAEMPNVRSRSFPCGSTQEGRSAGYGRERAEQQFASLEFAADACGRIPDRCCGPARTIGKGQFGKAVWYDHVGRPTASGEV